jgi:hypothetical protein
MGLNNDQEPGTTLCKKVRADGLAVVLADFDEALLTDREQA